MYVLTTIIPHIDDKGKRINLEHYYCGLCKLDGSIPSKEELEGVKSGRIKELYLFDNWDLDINYAVQFKDKKLAKIHKSRLDKVLIKRKVKIRAYPFIKSINPN